MIPVRGRYAETRVTHVLRHSGGSSRPMAAYQAEIIAGCSVEVALRALAGAVTSNGAARARAMTAAVRLIARKPRAGRGRSTLGGMSRRRAAILAAAAAALALALAACGGGSGGGGGYGYAGASAPPVPATSAPATTAPSTATAPAAIPVDVFFIRDERVVPASRDVTPPAVARGAMEALLAGPTAADQADGLTSSIPAGTRLLGLRVTPAGVAEVDLSGEFASGGGSLSMLTRVAQVVYTLTSFPTVRSVRFLIDGRRVEAIGGEGVIVDHPLTRADVAGQAPAG